MSELVPAENVDPIAVQQVFAAALEVEPTYLPQVVAGDVTLGEWFAAKRPDWSQVALVDGVPVGHVSVRRNQTLSDGSATPVGLVWELGRLAVHPRARRAGIGSTLVRSAVREYGEALWATCVAEGPSHQMFRSLGWARFADVVWDDDPAPGVALAPAGGWLDLPA